MSLGQNMIPIKEQHWEIPKKHEKTIRTGGRIASTEGTVRSTQGKSPSVNALQRPFLAATITPQGGWRCHVAWRLE